MSQNIYFLSASVPDPNADHFVESSDTVAITAAVKALVYVILGRHKLVWGGHPAITPMIWSIAESLGVDYSAWVSLYQSKHFNDRFPEDNKRFGNIIFTDEIIPNIESSETEILAKSLFHMRKKMFTENKFTAAIFIGGMRGVVDEFEMMVESNPIARNIPITTTGGVTKLIAERSKLSVRERSRLARDVDYIPLFYELLDISPSQPRLIRPKI